MWIDRRWLMIGVGGSLILNVFLIGVVAGHAFGHVGGAPAGQPNLGALVPPRHVRALPPDERKLFASAMVSHRKTIRAARQEQRRLRLQTEVDIAASTFDRDKVAADFKALRESAMAAQGATQDGLLDALQTLSSPSRAALVAHEDAGVVPAPANHP